MVHMPCCSWGLQKVGPWGGVDACKRVAAAGHIEEHVSVEMGRHELILSCCGNGFRHKFIALSLPFALWPLLTRRRVNQVWAFVVQTIFGPEYV